MFLSFVCGHQDYAYARNLSAFLRISLRDLNNGVKSVGE